MKQHLYRCLACGAVKYIDQAAYAFECWECHGSLINWLDHQQVSVHNLSRLDYSSSK